MAYQLSTYVTSLGVECVMLLWPRWPWSANLETGRNAEEENSLNLVIPIIASKFPVWTFLCLKYKVFIENVRFQSCHF